MKKIVTFLIVIISIFGLTGCYKRETTTFAETTYILESIHDPKGYSANNENFYTLNDATLIIELIEEEEYRASQSNVLASRLYDEYYKVYLSLTIDDVLYDNITVYEIEGTSAYPGRYWFWYELEYNDELYKCTFRMDIQNVKWINDFEESRANQIRVYVADSTTTDFEDAKYQSKGFHIAFTLEAQ